MPSEFVMPSNSNSNDTSVEATQKEEQRNNAGVYTEASKIIEADSKDSSIDSSIDPAAQDDIIEELKEADYSNIAVTPSTRRFIPKGPISLPTESTKIKTPKGK